MSSEKDNHERLGAPAYTGVAIELRERIISGRLTRGDRLPSEAGMAREFGVSRATVREALRLLSAQDLIRTSKGVHGGSVVAVPRIERVADYLSSSINLLAASEHITLDELLEARALLEVPAARLAARRQHPGANELQVPALAGAARLSPQEKFELNRDFHGAVFSACGNPLLTLAAQPIYTTLMTKVDRSRFSARFERSIVREHRDIAAAIAAGDEGESASLMERHLDHLAQVYARAWRTR